MWKRSVGASSFYLYISKCLKKKSTHILTELKPALQNLGLIEVLTDCNHSAIVISMSTLLENLYSGTEVGNFCMRLNA